MAGERHLWLGAIALAALALAALALLWSAAETSYRACVEGVSARYPPIAVSAFSRAQTGPLKVAYDAERAAALEDCDRVPF